MEDQHENRKPSEADVNPEAPEHSVDYFDQITRTTPARLWSPETRDEALCMVASRWNLLVDVVIEQRLPPPVEPEEIVSDFLSDFFTGVTLNHYDPKHSVGFMAYTVSGLRMHLRRYMKTWRDKAQRRPILFSDAHHGEAGNSGEGAIEALVQNYSNISSSNPTADLENLEEREAFKRCMDRLSPRLCAAFKLVDIEGLTTGEAAERLSIKAGTLRARVFRAREMMLRCLRPRRDP